MIEKRQIPLEAFPENTDWGDAAFHMYCHMPLHKEVKGAKSYDEYPTSGVMYSTQIHFRTRGSVYIAA
jgi:hypothetical protein